METIIVLIIGAFTIGLIVGYLQCNSISKPLIKTYREVNADYVKMIVDIMDKLGQISELEETAGVPSSSRNSSLSDNGERTPCLVADGVPPSYNKSQPESLTPCNHEFVNVVGFAQCWRCGFQIDD